MSHSLKRFVEVSADAGTFLVDTTGYRTFADLDGQHARQFLTGLGFEVISRGDNGRNGFAETACGIILSTNGYIHRKGGNGKQLRQARFAKNIEQQAMDFDAQRQQNADPEYLADNPFAANGCTVFGSPHAVMCFIGHLADDGDDVLERFS